MEDETFYASPLPLGNRGKTVQRRSQKSWISQGAGAGIAHVIPLAAYGATGSLAMVMKVMGDTDARTAMQCQHPVLDSVRDAIDQRNLCHKPRHNELRVQ